MSNRKMRLGLAAFYIAAMFMVGCIPEDSLQWSEDGSIGLLKIDEALYIVDGNSGELTEVSKSNVVLLPDISKDGSLIAYSERVDCNNLSEGLKVLPAGQVKTVKYYAEQTRINILRSGGLVKGEFPFPDKGLLTPHKYRNWAIRYLCENADSKILEILGKEGIEKGKKMELGYFQVVVAPRENLSEKRVAAVNLFATMSTRLSPDGRSVAYLMHTQEGEVSNAFEEVGLYIASLDSDIKAMHVDSRVTTCYDWREDGKAIAYISANSKDLLHEEPILGTLNEKIAADADGRLLAEPTHVPEGGTAGTHRCTGKNSELAGLIFNPWLKVEYGPGERLFFSCSRLTLPTSRRDEARWSVFFYDPVTATVADVLPASVSDYTSEGVSMLMFSMSPDGEKVLLPIEKNRFLIYKFGDGSTVFPIEESEGFGEKDIAAFLPEWKGNDEISCMVSEKSRFLTKDKEKPHKRKEIVILGADGEFRRILSENWPDTDK